MNITIPGTCPILCFGGPYSSLQATEAIRREAQRLDIPPDRVICTGDIVAYCANPNETVDLIREWGCHVIKGNCEEQLAQRAGDCGCGFGEGTVCDLLSNSWYAFADRSVRDDVRAWMAELPTTLTFDIAGRRARVIHGGVRVNSRFIFASTPAAEKVSELNAAGADLVIAGHCGIPFVQHVGERVWFNPGVIGMPANDGSADGWYGLIEGTCDNGGLRFSLTRLGYDSFGAATALRQSGHANGYAEALLTGRWPSLDVLPDKERAATGHRLAAERLLLT
ncbi:MAG: diadenosine tetraphosphatase [Alphaproteobacteria bacterium BRH_c36]|nr:MAG: diadenosine tetraphosphatase [Alphaproteobacteria bacterium BRH_c36]